MARFQEIEKKMKAAVEATDRELNKIHAGRANASVLDPVDVEAYGTVNKLNQVASINVPDAKHIIIQPWDKSLLGAIEKAIFKANLGFTPNNDGNVIRIQLPPLTGERRKELVKQAKQIGEDGRISVRNIRKHNKSDIEESEKKSEISEDDKIQQLKDLQEMTDKHIKKIDEMVKAKEEELLQV